MYTNINSLQNKVHDIKWEINRVNSVDIIALTETKLGSEINYEEVGITGFQIFRKDRNAQGEVAVCVRNHLKVYFINLESDAEALFFKSESDILISLK